MARSSQRSWPVALQRRSSTGIPVHLWRDECPDDVPGFLEGHTGGEGAQVSEVVADGGRTQEALPSERLGQGHDSTVAALPGGQQGCGQRSDAQHQVAGDRGVAPYHQVGVGLGSQGPQRRPR